MTSTFDAASVSSSLAASSASSAAAAAASASASASAAAVAAAVEAAIHASAGNTFGALLIGVLLSFLLYGFACAQTWEYFMRYRNDSPTMKILVAFIWALNTLHRIFDIDVLWFYLVTRGDGDILKMLVANWSLLSRLIPSEIAIALVQGFFIMRLWLFSGRKFVCWSLAVPVFASLAFALVYTIRVFHAPDFADAPEQKWVVICYSSIRAGTDILISGALSFLLYQKKKVSMAHLQGVLRVLFKYSITTGVLASTMATLVLVLYIAMPSNLIYIGAYDVYGILFFNSMLASLNGRESLRAAATRDHILSDLSSGQHSVRVQVPVVQTVEYSFDDRPMKRQHFDDRVDMTSSQKGSNDADTGYPLRRLN